MYFDILIPTLFFVYLFGKTGCNLIENGFQQICLTKCAEALALCCIAVIVYLHLSILYLLWDIVDCCCDIAFAVVFVWIVSYCLAYLIASKDANNWLELLPVQPVLQVFIKLRPIFLLNLNLILNIGCSVILWTLTVISCISSHLGHPINAFIALFG